MTLCIIDSCTVSFRIGLLWRQEKTVLDNISLTLHAGEIYGLLGINGAGKTTLIHTLLWLLTPKKGSVSIFWFNPRQDAALKRIGYAPDATQFFSHLTGWENAMVMGRYGGSRSEETAYQTRAYFVRLGLAFAQDSYVQTYSAGMKKRLGIILSLIHNPDLLVWDEPMSWLDPLGRAVVRELMLDLRSQKKTILFSTHILPDVQDVANRFGILHQSTLCYEGNVAWTNVTQTFESLVQSTDIV